MQLSDPLLAQSVEVTANRVVAENGQGKLRFLVAREVCWQSKPTFAHFGPHAPHSRHHIRPGGPDDNMGDGGILIVGQGLEGDNDAEAEGPIALET
jgi:hypothetical protein